MIHWKETKWLGWLFLPYFSPKNVKSVKCFPLYLYCYGNFILSVIWMMKSIKSTSDQGSFGSWFPKQANDHRRSTAAPFSWLLIGPVAATWTNHRLTQHGLVKGAKPNFTGLFHRVPLCKRHGRQLSETVTHNHYLTRDPPLKSRESVTIPSYKAVPIWNKTFWICRCTLEACQRGRRSPILHHGWRISEGEIAILSRASWSLTSAIAWSWS